MSSPAADHALPVLLRQYRERLRYTLRDVERLTDGRVSNAYLSQVESGTRPTPTARILTALAQVYGVPVMIVFEAAGYIDGPSPEDIDRAYARVLADQRFRFGERMELSDLGTEGRRMAVELFELATGESLL